MAVPELSVVVPAHGRPARLRRLLDALHGQSLARHRWEVVVATTGSECAEVVVAHPVGARLVRPAATSAAAQRNAGWRAAAAPVVVFTDDDCRPPPDWLERALGAVAAHPGAIVQGATRPDPEEAHRLGGRHARSQSIDPPVPWAQTCNIAYPRALLERSGGFEESMAAGEDTELAHRVIALSGAALVGAPEMLTHHAVEAPSLAGHLRTIPRWSGLALVVKRHPQLRTHLIGGLFWKPGHAWLPLAAAGAVMALRGRPLLGVALVLPWARASRRPVRELPTQAVVDAAEMLALARGSIRHRTVLL